MLAKDFALQSTTRVGGIQARSASAWRAGGARAWVSGGKDLRRCRTTPGSFALLGTAVGGLFSLRLQFARERAAGSPAAGSPAAAATRSARSAPGRYGRSVHSSAAWRASPSASASQRAAAVSSSSTER